ncbi:calcitonin gene-related peptide type 1 receptor-like [Tachypleus tridentatus]
MKTCGPNGTWLVTKHSKEWTDYSRCGIVDSLRNRLYFHVITFAVSISALIPALLILSAYKQLRVPRITIHKNLFLSLVLNGTFIIIFRTTVISEETDARGDNQNFFQENGPGCKVLFVATKYFRMTSYMWMFCEGFYLHRLITATFTEHKNLITFYAIGWGLPIIPVGVYAVLRKALKDERCWVIPIGTYEWVMNGPYLCSLLLNLAFLCNIVRNLVTKIRATHPNEPSQCRKAVRGTLILVPLFGVHFFLDKYRPSPGECGWMDAYIYFSFAIDGLQGFVVALIFCYLNGEVISLLKRSYQRYKFNIHSLSTYPMVARLSTSNLDKPETLRTKRPLKCFTRDQRKQVRAEIQTSELM